MSTKRKAVSSVSPCRVTRATCESIFINNCANSSLISINKSVWEQCFRCGVRTYQQHIGRIKSENGLCLSENVRSQIWLLSKLGQYKSISVPVQGIWDGVSLSKECRKQCIHCSRFVNMTFRNYLSRSKFELGP